ncbi:hypothetical protein [Desulfoluna sp.]|uniref:hypothetical protein n=1 Tax=Desulfoluna sp. TaxID=2045199 RepID=UPI00261FA6EA|nr:hypothetical protein [Desulfoluna sp.]
MKRATAQAGLTIAMEDVTLYTFNEVIEIANPDNPASYMTFKDVESLSNFAYVDGYGATGLFTLDVFTVNDSSSPIDGEPLLFIEGSHWGQTTSTTISNINICGIAIGSMAIDAFSTPSFHLYLGAHGSGIDMELGARISIDKISYGTSSTDTLALSGITLADSFTDNPSDNLTAPTTWKATGEFKVGNIAHNNPATLDVAADALEFWHLTDKGGTIYSVPNPRAGSGFIAVNMPMKGSVRVENMAFGANNFGAFALDNIQAHKLYIEIPGRGLGTP